LGFERVAFLEQAVNGLMMGSIYALFAVGMVLVFGVMRVLNFAHGVIFMAGGYLCQVVMVRVVASYPVALLLSALGGAVIGLVLERLVFRRLRENLSMQIVASLGLILMAQNAVLQIFGPDALQIEVPSMRAGLRLGSLGLTLQQLLIMAVVGVSVVTLHLFLTRSRLGTAMRAASQDLQAARVVGIDPDRVFAMTFALAGALAALGGALLGPLFLVFPGMGDLPLLKGLTAIVLGGMGSVGGAVLGGLAIGVLEAESTLFAPTDYRDLVVFAVLILVLLLRPYGLFGRRMRGEP
jgi:branched-chain amino acid transport system permease protein